MEDHNFDPTNANQNPRLTKKKSKIFTIFVILLFLLLLPLIILLLVPLIILFIIRYDKIRKNDVMESALILGFSNIDELKDKEAVKKITKNYHILCLKFHPDKNTNIKEDKIKNLFQNINKANKNLGNKKKLEIFKEISDEKFQKFKEKFNSGKYKNELDPTKNLNIFESIIIENTNKNTSNETNKKPIEDIEKEIIKISEKISEDDTQPKKKTFLEEIDDVIKNTLKNRNEENSPA